MYASTANHSSVEVMGTSSRDMKVDSIAIIAAWGLFVVSLALPAWRITGNVLAAGDWRGFQSVFWYYPLWIPNGVVALAPLVLLLRGARASLACAVASWIALIIVVAFGALETVGHGFMNFEGRPLIGFHLWLLAYIALAIGVTLRWRTRK